MSSIEKKTKKNKETILIADSGGSKIDWKLVSKDNENRINTPGFNPCNQSISDLKHMVEKKLLPHFSSTPSKVFFYGAGLDIDRFKDSVRSTLQCCIPHADIETHSDLMGAARALCGNAPGIVCILGTGSNCGWYDGKDMHCKIPSLGWILSDEGSGSYLGKRLIRDYLQKKTPPSITRALHKQYPWSKDEFLQHIYKGNRQATFLGSFSPFVAAHIKDAYCHQLVCSGFKTFCENNIVAYKNYSPKKVYFTGSIAHHYAELLQHVANTMNIAIDTIIRTPIDRLTAYHQKNIATS